jgi:hypothetical protein
VGNAVEQAVSIRISENGESWETKSSESFREAWMLTR